MRKIPVPMVLIAGALILGPGACRMQAPEPEGEGADPVFTGEVKPVLYVRDVERSAAYFRDVLGFAFLGFSNLDGAPYYAEMGAGPLKFGLHNALNEEQGGWIGHQRVYFRVRDVAAQRDRVLAEGGAPGELRETAWMDMFIVRDLDGHEIVFASTDPEKHTVDPW